MKTIARIIDIYGGLDALRTKTIDVRVPGHLTLTIEYIGECNDNWPMIAVSHYQDEQVIQTVQFAVDPEGKWWPLTYQREGKELLAGFIRKTDNRLVCWLAVQKEIRGYLRLWSAELRDRGYLKAAKVQSKHPHN